MTTFLRLSSVLLLTLTVASCTDETSGERGSRLGGPDPVACIEILPDCADGEVPADTDGDGCLLECAPAPASCPDPALGAVYWGGGNSGQPYDVCLTSLWGCDTGGVYFDDPACGCGCMPVVCPAIAVDCPDGQTPIDADGDGCALECGGVVCPPVVIECSDGSDPVDSDGDGCALECPSCPEVEACAPGETLADLDGDGCLTDCVPFACPEILIECPDGNPPIDMDGDGCAMECGGYCGNP